MVIFSEHSAFFAAPLLSEVLNLELYVTNTDFNNFFGSETILGKYCGNNTENIKDDEIIIIGITALKKISNRIIKEEFKRVILILCDTYSCLDYIWWNEFVENNNIELYIMPDLQEFCFIKYKPIYQYIKIDNSLMEVKNDKLLITHSPRSKIKHQKKGSNLIIKTVNKLKVKYDFDFELITGLSASEVIKKQSKSHIFIDQLVYKNEEINQSNFGGKILYKGGLGKSGIQGMLLNCAVITGGVEPKTEPHFEKPPITWTSADTFYNDLERLIVDEVYRNKQITTQNNWVKKYNNSEFFKKYLNI